MAQGTPPGGTVRTCPDAFADVYFMPDANKYPDGLPPGITEGLPKQHLRLPRAMLQLRLTGRDWRYIYPNRLCHSTAFAAVEVFYSQTRDLARRLGLAYDAPSPYGDQLFIVGGGSARPVDDSADREGTAHRGAWVLDDARGPATAMYFFCLPPLPSKPSLREPCYATASTRTMGYTTGTFHFLAQPFLFTTYL